MTRPDLSALVRWFAPANLDELHRRRLARAECRRERKLGTVHTLWLMLAVSLDSGRPSLHEILRLATPQLDLAWSVSVPAFCQARKRFSPPQFALAARAARGGADRPDPQAPLARLTPAGSRSHHSDPA